MFQLTTLGIGAVIGAGIFVLSGVGAHYAGPGIVLSLMLSGLACAFAGLCYAEFAAMIPLPGSAYTYGYATLGEIFAWIIGWDLTLEYAMGASRCRPVGPTTSSNCSILSTSRCRYGWHTTTGRGSRSGEDHRSPDGAGLRFHAGARHAGFLIGNGDHGSAIAGVVAEGSRSVNAPHLFGFEIGFNVPAFVIALVITAILVVGIKESARFNATIVTIKVGVSFLSLASASAT